MRRVQHSAKLTREAQTEVGGRAGKSHDAAAVGSSVAHVRRRGDSARARTRRERQRVGAPIGLVHLFAPSSTPVVCQTSATPTGLVRGSHVCSGQRSIQHSIVVMLSAVLVSMPGRRVAKQMSLRITGRQGAVSGLCTWTSSPGCGELACSSRRRARAATASSFPARSCRRPT